MQAEMKASQEFPVFLNNPFQQGQFTHTVMHQQGLAIQGERKRHVLGQTDRPNWKSCFKSR